MQSELIILGQYLVIVGMAAGFYSILTVSSGEGMLLGTVLVTLIMYAGGLLKNFPAAVFACTAVGCAGWVIYGTNHLRQWKQCQTPCTTDNTNHSKADQQPPFLSVELFFLTLLFTGSMFLFHNDFVQKIDDFHQWAAAVKYMLERGHLPQAQDFIGTTSMPMFTSVFHLYFQIPAGYNEGHMYVSSFFLNAVAIILPLCRVEWRKWKPAFLYTFTVYIGLYTFYLHSYKSLYVDLPVAAWAAAVCIWMSQTIRRSYPHRKRNTLLLLFPAVFMVIVIKQGIGILLAVFDFLYIVADLVLFYGWKKIRAWIRRYRKSILTGGLTVLAVAVIVLIIAGKMLIPVSGGGFQEAILVHSEKAKLTLHMLLRNLVSKTLNSRARLHVKALPSVLIFSGILAALSYIRRGRERKQYRILCVFILITFTLYVAALYMVYVSTFSYEESVKNAAVHRYLSVIVLYEFFLLMAAVYGLFGENMKESSIIARIGICAVLLCSVNNNFISDVSHYHFWKIHSYRIIKKVKMDLSEVEKLVPDDEKVYLLVQNYTLEKMNEFPMCVPLYYRENMLSNYIKEPWKFNENGSLRLLSQTDIQIKEFPNILTQGAYCYVWIYSVDDYLKKELPDILNVEGGPQDHKVEEGLYRCIRDRDGKVTGLRWIDSLQEDS